MSISNSVVHWIGYNCFEIDIGPRKRKSIMASITGYDDGFLTIEFRDRSWVTINYPSNLDDLAKEIESGLLEYKGWKRERLSAHKIKRIMNYLMEYLEKIKQTIRIQNTNTNKYVFKSSIRSTTLIPTQTSFS
jgi:hypothetical protein